MEFTGERFVPGNDVDLCLTYEHKHRYEFLSGIVKGKQVVDIACGEGYGSHILSGTAANVVGVDISDDAVKFAKEKYSGVNNLSFIQGSVTNIPVESNTVDIMVSFETIEHIHEHDEMLSESKRILKDDGLLIISTPDKRVYTDESGEINQYHVKELYRQEFVDLLKKYYPQVDIYGQRFVTTSSIIPETSDGKPLQIMGEIEESDSTYLIAICRMVPHQESGLSGSLYFNKNEDIFAQSKKKMRWASSIHSELMKAQSDYQKLEMDWNKKSKEIDDLTRELKLSRNGFLGKIKSFLKNNNY